MSFITSHIELLSDLTTPVNVFLKLREHYPEILLLESSEYGSRENNLSFICFDSLMTLKVEENERTINDKIQGTTLNLTDKTAIACVDEFVNSIKIVPNEMADKYAGVFGFSTFDMVTEWENIPFGDKPKAEKTPLLRYDFFRYMIVFDHYFEKLILIENRPENENESLDKVLNIISRQDHQTYPFSLKGETKANMTDQNYLDMVNKAKQHCKRGDVFQMVLSRRFSQQFEGDEFNVYRTLRSINPSPYLFYFDYSQYKIFGSSPEAQMVVKDNKAEIHPIAGTFRRTGDYQQDQVLAQQLLADDKENAEHIMLVDLARNDLSKSCRDVKITQYKEVQYFSHVIHLVSKVTGTLKNRKSKFKIFADTFPAGTLSGAPKHKALGLITEYEPNRRGFYGGGIGLIKLNGDINHAIIIRSFLSQNNELHFQSGAGIVIDSVPENELNEVQNKLAALKKALIQAQNL